MKTIHRKLLRSLAHNRGAVGTIGVLVAAGVAAFAALQGTYGAMLLAKTRFYDETRFADVFSELKRAPTAKLAELRALAGVARLDTRVVGRARVPIVGLPEPAQAHVISLPPRGTAALNDVRLLGGRMPNPERDDEALLIESFAAAHNLSPGLSIDVIMEGRLRRIAVVGTAVSPEYLIVLPAGAITPAPDRFAVLWMPLPAVETVFDMKAAFNSIAFDLVPGAPIDDTVRRIDAALAPYGGADSVRRERQGSNVLLSQELDQLGGLATLAPVIFLGLAAFLLNIVLSRLIELERTQIATLKALGYTDWQVGWHYLQFTLIVAVTGAVVGLLVATWLGDAITELYLRIYRLPKMAFREDAVLVVTALAASSFAACAGSLSAVRRVLKLPPAEAMRPPAPPNYAQGWLARLLNRSLGASSRMIVREILRRPGRTMFSALGIGVATGLVVMGVFFTDGMQELADVYLQTAQRESIAVTLASPLETSAARALRTLPGVVDLQAQMTMRVRVAVAQRERITNLVAHDARNTMRPLLDERGRVVAISQGEVIVTDMLAKTLGLGAGSGRSITVTPLEGDRRPRRLTVAGTISELMGLTVHMRADDLAAWLGSNPVVNEVLLSVSRDKLQRAQDELWKVPQVAGLTRKDRAVREFRRQNEEALGAFARALTVFAIVIAVAVVYNNARVALSTRSRELASLRVLGFTRGEISRILLGELSVQVVLGIPLGFLIGRMLVDGMLSGNDPESFRFPEVIRLHTFTVAATVVLGGAALSAFLVRRKLDKLDLLEVLKTRG